jgi:hypothetical protein
VSVVRISRAAAGSRSPSCQNNVIVRRQPGSSTGIQTSGTCAATCRARSGQYFAGLDGALWLHAEHEDMGMMANLEVV